MSTEQPNGGSPLPSFGAHVFFSHACELTGRWLSVASSHTRPFRCASLLLETSVLPLGSRSFISETVLEWFS